MYGPDFQSGIRCGKYHTKKGWIFGEKRDFYNEGGVYWWQKLYNLFGEDMLHFIYFVKNILFDREFWNMGSSINIFVIPKTWGLGERAKFWRSLVGEWAKKKKRGGGQKLYAILHTLIHTLCLSKYATLPITLTADARSLQNLSPWNSKSVWIMPTVLTCAVITLCEH